MDQSLLFIIGMSGLGVLLMGLAYPLGRWWRQVEWSQRVAGRDVVVRIGQWATTVSVDGVVVPAKKTVLSARTTFEFALPAGQHMRAVVSMDTVGRLDCVMYMADAVVFDSSLGVNAVHAPVDEVVAAARLLVSDIESRDPIAGATARSVCEAFEDLRVGGLAPDGAVVQAHRALGASDSELAEVDRSMRDVHDQLMATLRDLHAAVLPSSRLLTEDVVGRAEEALDQARAMREVQRAGLQR